MLLVLALKGLKLAAYLSLATSHCDVHEPTGVCDSLLGSALRGLLLLLRLNL